MLEQDPQPRVVMHDRGAQQGRRARRQQVVGESLAVAAATDAMHVELRVDLDAGVEQTPDQIQRGRALRSEFSAVGEPEFGTPGMSVFMSTAT